MEMTRQGCEEIRTLIRCWWECKRVQPLWKTVCWFLKKLHIELLHDPATPLLGTYTAALKAGTQTDICTPMLTAALFSVVEREKQPKCPPTNEWLNKAWHKRTREYHSTVKRHGVLICAITWVSTGDIPLSEISKAQKTRCCMIHFQWNI